MSGHTQHFPLSLPHTSDLAAAESNRQLLDALNQTGQRSVTSQQDSSPPAPYELDPASSFFPLLPYGFFDSVDTTGWQCQIGSKGTGSITRVFDQQTQCDVIELLSSPTNPLINYQIQGMGATDAKAATQSLSSSNGGKSLAIPIASSTTSGASVVGEQSTFAQSLIDREKTVAAVKRRQAAELADTSVEFPSKEQFIGTALPVLNVQMKNLNKYVSLSVEIEDTTGKLHRFTISNSCTVVRIRLDSADLPLTLTQGWNKLTLNLADLTQACFNSTYSSTHRVRILASCRLRRVYFSDQAYPDFALPSCLRIFSQAFYDAQRRERATEAAEEGEQATEGAEGRGNRRKGAQEEKEQSKPRPSRLREQLQGELAAARALESQMDPLNSDSGEASNQLFEHRLLDSQEARILAKHAETRASWAAFKSQTAARLGVRETDLNISRTDHFRAKQEELALLVHSIPESEKQGAGREEMWAGSLRGTGDSYVGVGNMFSGLWTKVKSNANPKVEIVRKPAATR